MKSKYKAMVLSCIDPRFQLPVFKFIKKKNLVSKHSSFTIAGAAVGVTPVSYTHLRAHET